ALLYDDPAITPRALDKAALAYRQAGKTDEADRLSRELRERYPNYAAGGQGINESRLLHPHQLPRVSIVSSDPNSTSSAKRKYFRRNVSLMRLTYYAAFY